MENVKKTVSQNLIRLRKENNLTQAELAKLINYSDKAISRWETGEVVPDLETIYSLSEVFGVPVSEIIEEPRAEDKFKDRAEKKDESRTISQKILSQIFLLCEIWLIITVVFVYLKLSRQTTLWQLFVWGVPASAMALWIYNRRSNSNILLFICSTVFTWSFITCVFLHLLDSNPWYMFFIGLPIQGLLIIRYIFNYKQSLKRIKLPRDKNKQEQSEEE